MNLHARGEPAHAENPVFTFGPFQSNDFATIVPVRCNCERITAADIISMSGRTARCANAITTISAIRSCRIAISRYDGDKIFYDFLILIDYRIAMLRRDSLFIPN